MSDLTKRECIMRRLWGLTDVLEEGTRIAVSANSIPQRLTDQIGGFCNDYPRQPRRHRHPQRVRAWAQTALVRLRQW